jgi:rSAM-associated Gly-rich repeat protein
MAADRASRHSRLSKTLSLLLPAGMLGMSVLLATSAPKAEAKEEASKSNIPTTSVADQLKAIRAAVTVIEADQGSSGTTDVTRVWWGNGGWGRWRGGWGNGGWGWRNGWPNGGWGNGGWRNGGWGNGWHNGWRNW